MIERSTSRRGSRPVAFRKQQLSPWQTEVIAIPGCSEHGLVVGLYFFEAGFRNQEMNVVENNGLLEPLIFQKLDLYLARRQQERLPGLGSRLVFGVHAPVSGLHARKSVVEVRYPKSDMIHRCPFAAARGRFLSLLQEDQNTRENQRHIRRKVIAEPCAQRQQRKRLFIPVFRMEVDMPPSNS